MPSPKSRDDKVIGRTVNGTGSLVMRADTAAVFVPTCLAVRSWRSSRAVWGQAPALAFALIAAVPVVIIAGASGRYR